MKIFILNPFLFTGKLSRLSRKRQPLSLAYIASLLRNDHEIKLLDANALNLNLEDTINEIKKFNPEILILTSTPIDRWEVPSHAYIKFLINSLIKIINSLKISYIILTGSHGSVMPEWLLKKTRVNFIVRNEPELTVLSLINNIKDFSRVRGISFLKNGKVINNPDAERNKNLDKLPLPAYDLLPMDKYSYTYPDIPKPFSIIMSSRGCPFKCIYCLKTMMKDKYIARSPENVIAEIKHLVYNFNIKGIYFQDWEFMISRDRVDKICDLIIENKIEIKWGCNARATDIDDKIVRKMKEAGCVRINIGFETGSQKLLDISKKMVKMSDMQEAIDVCKKHKINIGIYSILNLPGETRKTIAETEKFLADNDLETMCSPNLPLPYFETEMYEMLKKQEGKDFDWENLEKYAGRVGTSQSPLLAKIYRWHYKHKYNWGNLYFFNTKFLLKIIKLIKSKL
ncbi:B12-binding domain-containing radical SAM protein [Patescibacteria group bacterium]|nr:B12-binding domain-containing radical SAM protein [Patescibacteria group bacterium]